MLDSVKSADPFASRRVRISLYSVSSQCHTATRFYRDSATPTTTQLNRYSQTPRLSDSLDSQMPLWKWNFLIGGGAIRNQIRPNCALMPLGYLWNSGIWIGRWKPRPNFSKTWVLQFWPAPWLHSVRLFGCTALQLYGSMPVWPESYFQIFICVLHCILLLYYHPHPFPSKYLHHPHNQ